MADQGELYQRALAAIGDTGGMGKLTTHAGRIPGQLKFQVEIHGDLDMLVEVLEIAARKMKGRGGRT